MIERRKDLLTRLIVDDMIDDLRAGIRLTSDKELAFFISSQLTTFGFAGCRILSSLPWLERSFYLASRPHWNVFECVVSRL
jgi:hypothetical protein